MVLSKEVQGMALNPDAFNDWIYEHIDDYSKEIEVYWGGAGSGKSHGGFQKVILKSLKMTKRRVLVLRKVGAKVKQSTFEICKRILKDEAGILKHCKVNASDMTITLPNGSQMLFMGLDDQEKIRSIDGITDIVMEEATDFLMEDYQQLNLRLRSLEPFLQIYIFFNPVSKQKWVYKKFFLEEVNPDRVRIIRTTLLDNKFLPKQYLERLMEAIGNDPYMKKVYIDGEFATLDKLVYPNYIIGIPKGLMKNKKPFIGLDFGFTNDPLAVVWGYYDDSIIYIHGDFGEIGMFEEDVYAEMVKHRIDRGFGSIICDSAEPKAISRLRSYNLDIRPYRKTKDAKELAIQWIRTKKLYINPNAKNTIREIEDYTFIKDKESDEYTNETVSKNDHWMDALRYGLEDAITQRPTPIVGDKREVFIR